MELPQTVSEFFTWIASVSALGFVVSVIAEVFPKWEILDPKLKRWIVAAISVALGVLSRGLIKYVPAGIVAGAQDWYGAVIGAIGVFATSQYFHANVVKRQSDAPAQSGASRGGVLELPDPMTTYTTTGAGDAPLFNAMMNEAKRRDIKFSSDLVLPITGDAPDHLAKG